jgi:hypothetical protein
MISSPVLPKYSLIVDLNLESMRVRVKPENGPTQDFLRWPISTDVTSQKRMFLPAVIAYNEGQVFWGFSIPHDTPRVTNLAALLGPNGHCDALKSSADGELKALRKNKSAVEIVSEFLGLALENVRTEIDASAEYRYTFLLPSHWRERESRLYMEAIAKVVCIDRNCVSFFPIYEAAAFHMVRRLLTPGSPRQGIVFVTGREGISPLITRIIVR